MEILPRRISVSFHNCPHLFTDYWLTPLSLPDIVKPKVSPSESCRKLRKRWSMRHQREMLPALVIEVPTKSKIWAVFHRKDDKKLEAHKVILAASSPFLRYNWYLFWDLSWWHRAIVLYNVRIVQWAYYIWTIIKNIITMFWKGCEESLVNMHKVVQCGSRAYHFRGQGHFPRANWGVLACRSKQLSYKWLRIYSSCWRYPFESHYWV